MYYWKTLVKGLSLLLNIDKTHKISHVGFLVLKNWKELTYYFFENRSCELLANEVFRIKVVFINWKQIKLKH